MFINYVTVIPAPNVSFLLFALSQLSHLLDLLNMHANIELNMYNTSAFISDQLNIIILLAMIGHVWIWLLIFAVCDMKVLLLFYWLIRKKLKIRFNVYTD